MSIEWGPEIAVDGKRPDWLSDDTTPLWWTDDPGPNEGVSTAGRVVWHQDSCPMSAIRLPADHFASKVQQWNNDHPDANPFVPFDGDGAPGDYDGSTVLMHTGETRAGYRWCWDRDPSDGYGNRLLRVIGYRPRAEVSTASLPMLGEWREITQEAQRKGLRRNPKYIPAIGEICRMSGPNCDDADGSTWGEIEVLWRDDLFIVTRTRSCWPTVTKLELALFEPAASDTPLDRFVAANPDADRATAERALAWRDEA